MKKSIGLLSALVVTSTFIVNCQQAPDNKRRVRPTGTTAATGSQSDAVGEKAATLPTTVCTKEVLDMYRSLYKNSESMKKTAVTSASTDAEKEAYKKLGVETLAKCDDLTPALTEVENQSCYFDAGVKSDKNALTLTQVTNLCNALGLKADTDVGLDNSYAKAAKLAAKTKQLEAVKGKPWAITDEGLTLFLKDNSNLSSYIIDGEIKTSAVELQEALTSSQTVVCTSYAKSSGTGLTDTSELANEVAISEFADADSDIVKDLDMKFKGKATILPVVIKHKDEQGATSVPLVCLNMDSEKLTVDLLKKSFGSVITLKTASAAVTTNSDAVASGAAFTADDLAAAQPAGSPQQQNLASGTAQMIAAANQQVASATAAVSSPAVVSGAAVVATKPTEVASAAVVTTSGTALVSSAAAVSGAAVVAEDGAGEGEITAEEVAALKDKAERLDKDATAAEASLAEAQKAYDAEKAKGASADKTKLDKLASNLEDEKAVARNARESANTAKTEYQDAVKKATPV